MSDFLQCLQAVALATTEKCVLQGMCDDREMKATTVSPMLMSAGIVSFAGGLHSTSVLCLMLSMCTYGLYFPVPPILVAFTNNCRVLVLKM